ncbi:MAG TPA: GNAT family N-acetyltransferase [Candidatus Limnocylindrales bacterium]|nr:GNAT family N-acetyltransferase [Candidatus Limnocylindrales bacterium]
MDRHPAASDAAHLNFVGSYRRLVRHAHGAKVREFGSVFAFTTGVPVGIFNGCIVAARPIDADLEAALDWLAGLDLPFYLWAEEDVAAGISGMAASRSLEPGAWLVPHMVLDAVTEPPPPRAGITVRTVTDPTTLESFRQILVADGLPLDASRRLFPDTFLADTDVRVILADLDGRPVGTAVAIRTGDVAGVYAVATLERVRRRGVGTAATWAAVAAGRAWGCRVVTLQSSRMGFGVYEAMGFRTVASFVIFRRPS